MSVNYQITLYFILVLGMLHACKTPSVQDERSSDLYPWCIVAYDSPERSPTERIALLKELGFRKYAYDWRDRHLDSTFSELKQAMAQDIEIIAVWLWLNAKRDSVGKLSPANNRLLATIEKLELKTTLWVGLSGNFFNQLQEEEALEEAIKIVNFAAEKAHHLGCKVALYNHSGWFGNPYNQLKVINALPKHKLSMVYNFHHGHSTIDEFPALVEAMYPHLSAVNLNGMEKDGQKILPIGQGDHEKEMIESLKAAGFDGPWGILGHVENVDVKTILEQNIKGLTAVGID